VFDALTDTTGVLAQRPCALQRAAMVMHDRQTTRTRLVDIEAFMGAVLDELGLTELVCSIPGLSAVGAAAILAETGDLTRFGGPRAVVKHAGLCPRDNASGHHQGKIAISGCGRRAGRPAGFHAAGYRLRLRRIQKRTLVT
jgi:transposase